MCFGGLEVSRITSSSAVVVPKTAGFEPAKVTTHPSGCVGKCARNETPAIKRSALPQTRSPQR